MHTRLKIQLILLLTLFGASLQLNAAAPHRVALVIGNAKYQDAPLANPANDASDMAKRLDELGFKVEKLINVNARQMKKAISKFGKTLKDENTVGLFYFAGHGLQVDGVNYLLPLGAVIESEADVEYEAVNTGRVLSQMSQAGNNLNMVILDACRNNPYARSWRSTTRGLARMEAPTGSLILYATSPGNVASDGSGRNGLFTEKLLASLDTSGLKVEEVFKKTAIAVSGASKKKQVPYIEGVILGDFYFVPPEAKRPEPVSPATSSTRQGIVQQPAVNNQAEVVFWQSVEKANDKTGFEAYLEQWPKGQFAALAQLRLKKIQSQQVAVVNVKPKKILVRPQQVTNAIDEQYFVGKKISGKTAKGGNVTIRILADNKVKLEVGSSFRGFKETGKWYIDAGQYICMDFSRFNGGNTVCRYPETYRGKMMLYARDEDPNKPVWNIR